MSTGIAVPRLAATVAVVRDGASSLEVLLLQRAERGDHNSGAWVFPGGLIDPGDADVPCAGLEDTQASKMLGIPSGGLAAYVAAVRECFEEAGLLFARDAQGRPAMLQADTPALVGLRIALQNHEVSMAQVCRDHGIHLAADQLHYIAHWITPAGRAKRFDTRFFVAVLPPGQQSAHDASETLDHVWLPPAQALAPENTRRLMTPTRSVLRQLSRFADSEALLAWAMQLQEVPCILPRLGTDAGELRPVLPHEAAWHEIGLLDPTGQGKVAARLAAGAVTRLHPRLVRVTADDGESNSYLVGDAAGSAWAVLGPVSDAPGHLAAIVDAAPGRIELLIPSQTQQDAARRLQPTTGARLVETDPGVRTQLSLGDGLLTCLREAGLPQVLLREEGLLVGGTDVPATLPELAELQWLAPLRGFLRPVSPPMGASP